MKRLGRNLAVLCMAPLTACSVAPSESLETGAERIHREAMISLEEIERYHRLVELHPD